MDTLWFSAWRTLSAWSLICFMLLKLPFFLHLLSPSLSFCLSLCILCQSGQGERARGEVGETEAAVRALSSATTPWKSMFGGSTFLGLSPRDRRSMCMSLLFSPPWPCLVFFDVEASSLQVFHFFLAYVLWNIFGYFLRNSLKASLSILLPSSSGSLVHCCLPLVNVSASPLSPCLGFRHFYYTKRFSNEIIVDVHLRNVFRLEVILKNGLKLFK